jgi:hypothetical protein
VPHRRTAALAPEDADYEGGNMSNHDTNSGETHEAVPYELQEYLDLDLSPTKEIAADLTQRVQVEVESSSFTLSDIIGHSPANLTGEMKLWHDSFIAEKRIPAMHAANAMVKGRAEHGEAFILQLRLGTLEERLLVDKRRAYENVGASNVRLKEKLDALKDEVGRIEFDYNTKRDQYGRDAYVKNRLVYYGILFLILFGAEAAINFESFLALPWSSPAIALGLTAAVGFGIGIAAHLHGRILKQWRYFFHPSVDDSKRGPAWRMFGIGTLMFVLAMSCVYYARSAYFIAYLASISDFGQSSESHSFLWIVGGSLFGNALIYLLGIAWAWFHHDDDEDFSELRRNLDRKRTELADLKQLMERELHRQIEQLTASYTKSVQEARRAFNVVSNQKAMRGPLELFKKFEAKDAKVVALLQGYRQALIRGLGQRTSNMSFQVFYDNPSIKKNISAGEYQNTSLVLKYWEE